MTDYPDHGRAPSWVETENQDNLLATATRAAPSGGKSHHITGVSGGYSAAAIGSLILKEGGVEIARWYVHNSFAREFSSPIKIAADTACSLELEASGTAAVIGAVNLEGHTL